MARYCFSILLGVDIPKKAAYPITIDNTATKNTAISNICLSWLLMTTYIVAIISIATGIKNNLIERSLTNFFFSDLSFLKRSANSKAYSLNSSSQHSMKAFTVFSCGGLTITSPPGLYITSPLISFIIGESEPEVTLFDES